MAFPIEPPVAPMLAKLQDTLPEGDGWLFEPKWDGFRVLVFRDDDELYLQSRVKKPLLRYFPELRQPLLDALPHRCVVDGELVIEQDGVLQFMQLQMRLHPAKSRIDKLAAEIPANIVLWDVLALDEDLRDRPLIERVALLEAIHFGHPVYRTPATTDRDQADDWFHRFEGAGLDGVMAKKLSGIYEPGKRTMRKLKHTRTLDCVVAGFRWHKNNPDEVGSLICALFDDDGKLHQVGVASSFSAKRRTEITAELAPLRAGALDAHPWAEWARMQGDSARRPDMKSRWNAGRDLSWEPVRLERSVEVSYNQLTGGRFRHPSKFVRWRPDKPPAECRYDQLDILPPAELHELFHESE